MRKGVDGEAAEMLKGWDTVSDSLTNTICILKWSSAVEQEGGNQGSGSPLVGWYTHAHNTHTCMHMHIYMQTLLCTNTTNNCMQIYSILYIACILKMNTKTRVSICLHTNTCTHTHMHSSLHCQPLITTGYLTWPSQTNCSASANAAAVI